MKKSLILTTVFLTGAMILVLEIAGTRILAPFYGTTIFVWTSLIMVTLGFLALGYWAGGRWADKHPDPLWFYLMILLGSISALALLKINRLVLMMSDRFGFRFGPLVAAFILFGLPLFFWSMSGPIVIRLRSSVPEKSGRVAGKIFGLSTFGSLLGALVVGFWLIPAFSLAHILTTSVMIVAVCALAGLWLENAPLKIILLSLVILTALLLLPYFGPKSSQPVSIIHGEPSFYGDLKIAETPYVRALLLDGGVQSVTDLGGKNLYASIADQINRVLTDWPLDADMLFLGLGGANVAQIVKPEMRTDYVDVDPKMVKLAEEYFGFRPKPDDRVIVEDARHFLRGSEKRYDIIFVDLYHDNMIPFHTSSKEAFGLMREHLKPGGILISNIVGGPNDPLLKSLIKTMSASFSKVIASSRDQTELGNVLVYALPNSDKNPNLSGRYKELMVDLADAPVITDDRNPTEALSSARLGALLAQNKKILGLEPFFSL